MRCAGAGAGKGKGEGEGEVCEVRGRGRGRGQGLGVGVRVWPPQQLRAFTPCALRRRHGLLAHSPAQSSLPPGDEGSEAAREVGAV